MRPEEDWLLALADSERTKPDLASRLDQRGVELLCGMANLHSVLPAVLQSVERMLREEPASLLLDPNNALAVSQALAPLKNRLAQRAAMSMFLSMEAKRLIAELSAAKVDAIILKGFDFATRIYPRPGLRTFGDMDLLIRPADWKTTTDVMTRLGYESHDAILKYADGYAERSWQNPAMPGATVEIHDNLVNSPTIRRGVSVRLEDLPLERGPDGHWRATSTGLLLIAAVHAAASHSFEKVQHLCDIAQAARGRAGAIDENILRECAAKTGAGFSLATALDVTTRAFKDPACAELLARLELHWPRHRVRLLVTPAMVVRSQGNRRRWTTWRRRTLRQMLKTRR